MTASRYNPAMAQGDASFTGTAVVDTGMRELDNFVCSLAQDSVAAGATVSWSRVARTSGDVTAKVNVKAWKADGVTAADVATKVSWLAMGR